MTMLLVNPGCCRKDGGSRALPWTWRIPKAVKSRRFPDMQRLRWIGASLAALLAAAGLAQAQVQRATVIEVNPPVTSGRATFGTPVIVPQTAPPGRVVIGKMQVVQGAPAGAPGTGGPEPASRPQELATEFGQPGAAEEGKLGPTPPEDVKLLMGTGLGDLLEGTGIRAFG